MKEFYRNKVSELSDRFVLCITRFLIDEVVLQGKVVVVGGTYHLRLPADG